MKYLLDTHILIWHFEGSEKLSSKLRNEILFSAENQLYISVVSLWEVAIKMNIGKYKFNGGFQEFYRLVNANDFIIIPIRAKHMEKLFDLPLIHRDPFDRLIISTSAVEKMTIVTADENIQKYKIPWFF